METGKQIKDKTTQINTKPKTLYSTLELSIRRKTDTRGLPGEDPANQNPKIGSALNGKAPLSGLSFEEEVQYLPEIIGTDSKDINFRRDVREYWSNISERIPHDTEAIDEKFPGKHLKFIILFETAEDKKKYDTAIGFESKSQFSKLGRVVEGLSDYILFRYCLVYKRVANDERDQHKAAHIDFFLHSREQKAKQDYNEFTLRNKARDLFSTLLAEDQEGKVDAILRMFKKNPEDTSLFPSLESKHMTLDELIKHSPKVFLEYAKDKKLAMKAFILKAVEAGVIFVPANTDLHYFGSDKEELLGRSLMETVLFLEDKSDKNAQILDVIKSQIAFKN